MSVKNTVSIVAMRVCSITSSNIKEDSPKNDPRKAIKRREEECDGRESYSIIPLDLILSQFILFRFM